MSWVEKTYFLREPEQTSYGSGIELSVKWVGLAYVPIAELCMEDFFIEGDDFYRGGCCATYLDLQTIDELIAALNEVKKVCNGSK